MIRIGVLAAALWWGPPAEPTTAAPTPATGEDDQAPLTVTTRLTPEPAHIGDLLELEVIVAFPQDHSVNLPSGLDFSPLELVAIAEGEVESSGRDLRQRFTLTLQYFDTGEASVPSFPITWIDPSDAVHTHHVPPHPFVVESLLANEADPQVAPEDPPVSLEYPNERLATIILASVAGLVLGGVILAAWLRFRRRVRPALLVPPIPPHERALSELARLEGERAELLGQGRAQEYYVRLTEITKRWLEGRFGLDALESTTDEIRLNLRANRHRIAPLDPDELLRFLGDCDLVKFARLSPANDEAEAALIEVRAMVERCVESTSPADPIVDPDQVKAARPGAAP